MRQEETRTSLQQALQERSRIDERIRELTEVKQKLEVTILELQEELID